MGKKKGKRAPAGEEEYHVERIIDRRENDGVVEYFLKWKGFSELENTWEPERNLNCTELLDQFNREYAKKSVKGGGNKAEASNTHQLDEKPSKGDKEAAADSQKQTKPVKMDKEKAKTDMENKEKNVKKSRKAEDLETRGLKRKSVKVAASPKKKKKNQLSTGFDKGYTAQSILGATDTAGGELHFLINWANTDEAELVPARIANLKIPQMIIKFYEERLIWTNGDSKKDDQEGEKANDDEEKDDNRSSEDKGSGSEDNGESNKDVPMDNVREEEPEAGSGGKA